MVKKSTRPKVAPKTVPKEKPDRNKDTNHRVISTAQVANDKGSLRVVGIGASAGGLDAFEHFFTHMAPDTGLAFVLIQHLDPTHKSILTDLVARYTAMPVAEVKDGMVVEPNSVYVIPPNKDMAILNGTLYLMEPSSARGLRQPIDFFFRSLADDLKDRAIAIILSGTGSEGTLGLRAIKGEGGMVMVQDPESAKYDGMPRSAIATGLVDYVLSPEKMPERLMGYVTHAPEPPPSEEKEHADRDGNVIQKILILVRARTHHDFTNYKKNTIVRRIERRLAVHQLARKKDYLRFLQEDPQEVNTLFKELIIGVTNFFRDPDAFEILKKKVFPKIFGKEAHQIRIWVPACATGEEAYSIGMLLQEYLAETKSEAFIQIFATDIDEAAIDKARAGIYPLSIAADVSTERLERFFVKDESHFRVKKDLREMVVFAVQDVVSDPPFSKLDLVSCRNLLIYMNAELQRRLIHLFHYAIKPNGFLLLGTSESVGPYAELYAILDRKWKVYQRRDTDSLAHPAMHFQPAAELREPAPDVKLSKPNLRDIAEKALLDNYSAAGVVIDERHDIIYFYGSTSKYLELAPGDATLNILKMARADLRFELANAIRKVQLESKVVQRPRLGLRVNGNQQVTVNLTVRPVAGQANDRLLLVVFEEVSDSRARNVPLESPEDYVQPDVDSRVRELEHELSSAKEYLQTTIEELETSNEELKSTNEELQSANEELQSTNEELETSKEEQQSTNEELVTVNSELQQKIELLSKTNDDMNNLLASTQVGTVFLDLEMNVRRFTPPITEIVNLIKTDVGRPLAHIVSNLRYDDIVQDAQGVLDTLIPKTVEVQTLDNRWFVMKLQPYRTTENVIDGVVVTFVDVTRQKREWLLSESIIDTSHEMFMILDGNLKVITANKAFCAFFAVQPGEILGKRFYDLGNHLWDDAALRKLLHEIIPKQNEVVDFEVESEFPNIGKRKMVLNAKQLKNPGDSSELIILAMQDVTGRSN